MTNRSRTSFGALPTPFLLINVIYTIVDSATYYDNPVMKEVGWKFDALEFGYCNSLSFGYCIVTLILVAIVYKLLASRAGIYVEFQCFSCSNN